MKESIQSPLAANFGESQSIEAKILSPAAIRKLEYGREYHRNGYIKDPEKYKKRGNEWRAKNQDKIKEYRKKNKDSRSVQHKKWRLKNLANRRKDMAEWRAKNPERCRQLQREARQRRPEYYAAMRLKWRTENPEKWEQARKKSYRNYRLKNPDVARNGCQTHRARKKSRTIRPEKIKEFMSSVRSKAFINCYYCRKPVVGKKAHIDHVVALASGGSHEIGNLCASCPSCNMRKSDTPLSEWKPMGQLFML